MLEHKSMRAGGKNSGRRTGPVELSYKTIIKIYIYSIEYTFREKKDLKLIIQAST